MKMAFLFAATALCGMAGFAWALLTENDRPLHRCTIGALGVLLLLAAMWQLQAF